MINVKNKEGASDQAEEEECNFQGDLSLLIKGKNSLLHRIDLRLLWIKISIRNDYYWIRIGLINRN